MVLGGHLEHDLAMAESGADEATRDVYESRYIDGEQYLALALGPVDVTVGRQIVAWGEGDAISPLDVVNPRDLREPGLADLDDLRLAVAATRVGWFPGDHRIELMAVHEQYFGERAPPLGEFSPLSSFIGDNPVAAQLLAGKTLRYEDSPERFGSAQNVLARWVYQGPGVDLGLYGASLLERQGVVVLDLVAVADPNATDVSIELDHRRYAMAGTSGATSFDTFLLKWELVYDHDKPFNVGDTGNVASFGVEEAKLLTPMAGLTWRGIADTNIALEWSQAFFLDEPDDLLFPADEPQVALRFTHEALRQRLQLTAAATAFGYTAQLGWVGRAQATYELMDGVRATVGYVTYQTPRDDEDLSPLTGLDDHDRVFAQLRWDFALSQ